MKTNPAQDISAFNLTKATIAINKGEVVKMSFKNVRGKRLTVMEIKSKKMS